MISRHKLMKENLNNEKLAISYALGEMTETERDEFEERLFTDENLSLSLDAAENDLIDEYLKNELAPKEKQLFEQRFLISERRREKLLAAEILQRQYFADSSQLVESPKLSIWQGFKNIFAVPRLMWAGSLAMLLLVLLGGIWLLSRRTNDRDVASIENTNQLLAESNNNIQNVAPVGVNQSNIDTSNEINNSTKTNSKSQNSKSNKSDSVPVNTEANKPNKIQKPQIDSPQPGIFAFSLLPPLRSSKRTVLNIPLASNIVRLRLYDNFGSEYVRFQIELNDASGNLIWQGRSAVSKKRSQKSITVDIPSEKLKAGTYELVILGTTAKGSVEEIDFYNFDVQKSEKE